METGKKRFIRRFALLILAAAMLSACAVPVFAETEDADNPFIYSDLNRTPGGTYGYLSTEEDELVFLLEASGITKSTEIRFFGVEFSIAGGVPSKDDSVKMAEEFLNKGINFICIKDVYEGLTSATGELDETRLAAFDAMIFEFYLKGIYVELDLFTPRSLGSSSIGVYVDSKVVDKAIRFLNRFFSHVGPNGVTYASESTVIIVKYLDNTSLSYLKTGEVNTYESLLTEGFNAFLSKKYETDSRLSSAWKAADGTSALMEGETLGNVGIGSFGTDSDLLFDTSSLNSARQADFVAYLTETAQASFDRIEQTLRESGYRSLILCSDASTGPLSTRLSSMGDAAAKTIVYDGSGIQNAMESAASGSVSGKPFILNWDTSYITTGKTKAFTELVVYSCLQGYDAFIAGEYIINPDGTRYAVNNDAEIWQQFGLFATIFRNRSVTPSRTQLEYVYTTNDTLTDTGNFGKFLSFASMMVKAGNKFVDDSYAAETGIAVTSGNSAGGDYSAATNNIIFQAYTEMQTPFMPSGGKVDWFNTNVEKKAMAQVDINGHDFRIGEKRAIAVDTTIDDADTLSQVLRALGLLTEDNGYVAPYINADNDQVTYNQDSGVMSVSGNRISAFTGPVSAEGITGGTVTYKGNGTDAAVVVYPMDSANIEDSESLLIYARGSSSSDMVTGTLTFQRENCTYEFYGINPDGTRSEVLAQTKMIESEDGQTYAEVTTETTVELNGEYQNYELVFKEKSIDDILVGYTPEFPERPNLLLLISIPAIIFLGLAYGGILLADKIKLKREERLRVASMESKLKNRIAHDEHIKRFEEEMEQERIEKERKAMEKEYGYNPLLDESIPEDIRRELAKEMQQEKEKEKGDSDDK